MFKKIITLVVVCIGALIVFTVIKPVKATDTWGKLEGYMGKTREGAGYAATVEGTNDATAILANVIRIMLAFVGAVFFILILWGGNEWLTAGGNDEKIAKAKKLFLHSVIGLAIVLIAYLITHLLITVLVGATGI